MDLPSPARPIKLYRFALSGHAHRAELFLSLLGLAYEPVDVDLVQGAHKRPEFLALNAFGQVPVIDDDGTVVADSNAILTYLALRYAPPTWLPRDPFGAAQVQRWLSAAAGPLAFGAARSRVVRFSSRAPSCASSAASRRTTAGSEECNAWAAAVRLPRSTIATKVSSARSLSIAA